MNKYNVVYRRYNESVFLDDEFIDVVLPWYLLGLFGHIMKINHFVLIYKMLEND